MLAYLMLGGFFGSAAKGTGLKSLEFALSICESVDMYGFTVDLGYKEWYRIYLYISQQSVVPNKVFLCNLIMFT